jgi:hypothetical protein
MKVDQMHTEEGFLYHTETGLELETSGITYKRITQKKHRGEGEVRPRTGHEGREGE